MSRDMNQVSVVGRVTRDAELKYTTSGYAVTKFSIATNNQKKQGDQWVDEASFIDITLWGKPAEGVTRFLTKGQRIGVEGRLKQERWEKDGQQRSKLTVVATTIQLLGTKPQAQGTERGEERGYDPSSEEFEDDIPF